MKNRNLLWIVVVASISVGASGCRYRSVELKGGRVPVEFLDKSKDALGTYEGKMEQNQLSFELRLDDGNLAVLAPSEDVVGEGCQSKVGNLQKIYFTLNDKKEPYVQVLLWALDPNLCKKQVEGRALVLYPYTKDGKLKFKAGILKNHWLQKACRFVAPSPNSSIGGWYCEWQKRYDYLVGDFEKVK